MKTTLPFYSKSLFLLFEFSYFLKIAIVILLLLACSYPLFAQPKGAWIEKQLPGALPTDKLYTVGENCVIYVGKNDSIIYTYDLTSSQWHEYNQHITSAWKYKAAGNDVAIVATDSILTAYSALSQSFSTINYEGTMLGLGGSSSKYFIGCMESVAYFITDKCFYVFDSQNSQWYTHPIDGLAEIDLDVKYVNPGYILIILTDGSHNEKLIAYSISTKQFKELNFTYDNYSLPIKHLDYGFVVWSHNTSSSYDYGFFGCYSAIHNTWTEHQESEEFFNVSTSSDADDLFPRTVYMFRVHKRLESWDVNHTFYIYDTRYPEPLVFSRTSNDDYSLHTFCVGAQTAVISFRNRSSNNLEIHSYQSDTHTMNPCIVSQLHVEQDFNWQSCGGRIYLGYDDNYAMGGYPNERFTGYAGMPAGYENTHHWIRDIDPRNDWGIMLFEDKDADTAYVYSYNIASADTITHFKTEWGTYSFLITGYNNKVAALLANTDTGYKLYFYSPVFDTWTEKASGPKSPYLKLIGDFIYYLEPNSKLISVFNGATNQQLDLPFGQTRMDLYTSSGENFLLAYTTDNKYVSYSAITGTSSEFETDLHGVYRGDESICISTHNSNILTYNALSDAFINLPSDAVHGVGSIVSVGGKTALVGKSNGYLYAFDPYKDTSTSIDNIIQDSDSPAGFKLEQNYPNPFNTITSIKFFITVPEHVRLEIYNTQGHKIRTLINRELIIGQHVIDFDSNGLPGGIYFYKLTAGSFQQSKKMILLK